MQISTELQSPMTLYLCFCPVCFLRFSLEPLFQPWDSATVKLDHFFPDVIILNTLGYSLCLDLVKENRNWLWAAPGHHSEMLPLWAWPAHLLQGAENPQVLPDDEGLRSEATTAKTI